MSHKYIFGPLIGLSFGQLRIKNVRLVAELWKLTHVGDL